MTITGTDTERVFAERMEADGWQVYKNGFPDFLCVKDGRTILVEVKADKHQKLQEHQKTMAALLTDKSLKVYRWSPDCPELVPFDKISIANSKYDITYMPNHKLAEILNTTPETIRLLRQSGVTVKQIAEVAGISIYKVYSLIKKAKQRLG